MVRYKDPLVALILTLLLSPFQELITEIMTYLDLPSLLTLSFTTCLNTSHLLGLTKPAPFSTLRELHLCTYLEQVKVADWVEDVYRISR